MPVYLSFLVCVLAGGGCHATVPVEEPFAGISACQMQGMMLAPQWLDQHPGWTIKRIRCSIGGRAPHDLGYCFQAALFIKGLRAARLSCIISLMVTADGDIIFGLWLAALIVVMMLPDRPPIGLDVDTFRRPPNRSTTIGIRCSATATRPHCIEKTNMKAYLAILSGSSRDSHWLRSSKTTEGIAL